jgi:hypothetical protein
MCGTLATLGARVSSAVRRPGIAEVARDDLQHEVDVAVQHVAFAHLRQAGDMRLEGHQVGLRLAAERTIAKA